MDWMVDCVGMVDLFVMVDCWVVLLLFLYWTTLNR